MIRKSVAALAALLMVVAAPARADDAPGLSMGQTVYVPVYSHIWHGNIDKSGKPEKKLLSTMLSVRNTDPDAGLTLRSVRYYDTAGKPLRDYLAKPLALGPMASTDFFVEHKDDAGGTGANFLVVWDAARPVNPPVVETVHAFLFGAQSAAFVSVGRPIRTTSK